MKKRALLRFLFSALLWTSNAALLFLAIGATVDSSESLIENRLLNGDALYPHSFIRDALTGESLATWNPPRAPGFFPDLLIVFPAVALARWMEWPPLASVYLAAFAQGFAWSLIYAWFFRRLQHLLFRNDSDEANASAVIRADADGRNFFQAWHAAPIATSLIFLLIAAGIDEGSLALLFVPTFHTATVLLFPFSFLLALNILRPHSLIDSAEGQSLGSAMALIALTALTVSSDVMFVSVCLLPLVLAAPYLIVVRETSLRSWLMFCGVAVIGLYLAGVVRRLFARWMVITETKIDWAVLFTGDFVRSLAGLFEAGGESESGDLLVEAGGALFAFVVVARAFLFFGYGGLRVPGGDRRSLMRWFALVQILTIAASLAGMLAVGYAIYRQPFWIRLALPGLNLAFVSAVFVLFAGFAERGRREERQRQLNSGALVGMVLIFAASAFWIGLRHPVGSANQEKSKTNLVTNQIQASAKPPTVMDMVHCVRRHSARIGRYGLGDYWSAKTPSFLTDGQVHVNQLAPHLAVSHWVSNFAWYYAPHRKGQGGYSFVIVNRLDRAQVAAVFGTPAEVIHCPLAEIFVYDRPQDAVLREYFSPQALDLWYAGTGRKR